MPADDDGRLLAQVRPPHWRNPAPRQLYDLVVIGGGTAGLVCAAGAAGLGARVALIERHRLGGDCLNSGCVPSKALLRSARVVGEMGRASQLGVPATARPDFGAVMARLRARRADLAPNDSASRLASLGVDVFFGAAAFAGPRRITVRIGEADDGPSPLTLTFRRAVIATGSRPAIPPIEGLADVPYLTNEDVFELRDRPEHLVVLGGGPVGCELAQAFARLGTRVTLIETAARLLPGEDPDASALVGGAIARDGVDIRVGSRATGVAAHPAGVRVRLDGGEVIGSTLLVATGRAPNVEGFGLEAAGVESDEHGIRVSDRMRTTSARIYASGDVASAYKFTHAADALSRIVIQNALFFGRKRASALIVPWCTFTDPELAHVGVRGADGEGRARGTITIDLRDVDRAVVDDQTEGFVRIHHQRGRIIGATVVGSAAGELIATIAHAMRHGHGLADLSASVFPYPTHSLALRQAGDAYRRATVTPGVRRALQYYFRLWR
jgi:pyruvate/2-oxoglutarate dehydrogenase complex dihydrolipoamide dehydrogenase (E3) component